MLPLSRPAVRPTAATRSSRPGRALRRACAVAAVALIPVLAGCDAGSNAPVLHWHPPTNGASATIKLGGGEIAIRNAFVLGAPVNAPTLPAGSSAGLFVGLVNTGPRDRLIKVSAPSAATSVTLPTGGVLLERDTSALLTGPEPKLILTGPDPQPAGRHLRQGAAHLPEGRHGEPGRPGAFPVELVRHVLAGPDGVADTQRVGAGQAARQRVSDSHAVRDRVGRGHRDAYALTTRTPRPGHPDPGRPT